MSYAISDTLIAAQCAAGRVPLLRAVVYPPGSPDTALDLSSYVTTAEVTLPPNFAAGYTQLTIQNPANVVSTNPLFAPDYVLDLYLGYKTTAGLEYRQVGRYYVDEPQRQFTVSPPQNTVVIQARDGVKLLMERHFTIDEWIDLSGLSVQDAIDQTLSYVTVAGVPMTVTYDTDDDTAAALADLVVVDAAGGLDTIKTAYDLLQQILSQRKLIAQFRGDGTLRIGMMNQTDAVTATIGGTTQLTRPIFGRNHRRSGREHYNWVHVEGDQVAADAVDQADIDAIGRVKYFLVDDPSIDSEEHASQRSLQELELSARFREQPDDVVPWLLDLERRDLITVDDQGVSGLSRSVYRVEDLHYTYSVGQTLDASLEIGMGLPDVDDADVTSTTF